MTARRYSPETQCQGKLRCTTKRDAKRAAKRQEQHGGGRMQAYHCPHCEAWHLGHKPERGYVW